MAEIVRLEGPDEAALAPAEAALRQGHLVVVPTDTVYGVAGLPDAADATGRLFEAKARSRALTLPVLAASPGDAWTVAQADDRARRLAERFWPGPLTMVLARTERALRWDLGEQRSSVGVRVPADEMALAVLARVGPLAVTSANRSGEPAATTCEEAIAAFGDAVDVYLCAGRTPGDVPSTVVDLTGPELRILRSGALADTEILSLLQ